MDFDTSTHKARWIFDQDALVSRTRLDPLARSRTQRGEQRGVRAVLLRQTRRPSLCPCHRVLPQVAKRAEVQQAAADSLKRSREPTPAAAGDAEAPPDAKKQRGEAAVRNVSSLARTDRMAHRTLHPYARLQPCAALTAARLYSATPPQLPQRSRRSAPMTRPCCGGTLSSRSGRSATRCRCRQKCRCVDK